MPFKDRTELLNELAAHVHSAGQCGPTTADDLKQFLTLLVDELLARTTAAVPADAEPHDYEELPYATVLARFAAAAPIRGKVYRIARPGGGVVEASFGNVAGWVAGLSAISSILSTAATVPGQPGLGRYDLATDTFTVYADALALQAQATSTTTGMAQKADKVQTLSGVISASNKIKFVRDTIFNLQTVPWASADFDFTAAVPGTTVIVESNGSGTTAPGLPTGSRVLFGTFMAGTTNLYHYTYLSAGRVLATITH